MSTSTTKSIPEAAKRFREARERCLALDQELDRLRRETVDAEKERRNAGTEAERARKELMRVVQSFLDPDLGPGIRIGIDHYDGGGY